MSTNKPGFSFLVCPDSQLLRTRLREQLAAFAPAHAQWERHVYWGDEEPPPRFWERSPCKACSARRARWSCARRNSGLPRSGKRFPRLWLVPRASWPFFCLEVNWEKGQPKIPAHIAKLRCVGFADQQGWIWRNEGLTERSVRRHVQQRAAALNLSFEPDALEQFCASVPPDAPGH